MGELGPVAWEERINFLNHFLKVNSGTTHLVNFLVILKGDNGTAHLESQYSAGIRV